MIRSLLIAIAAGAALQEDAVAQDTVAAFTHVSVIPMDRERILKDQVVLVRGSRIIAVGPADRTTVPAGAHKIDGRGKFLLPGFSDMHFHSGADHLEQGMLRQLKDGVTLVRDMRAGPAQLIVRARIASGQIPGPTMFAGRIYGGGCSVDSAVQFVVNAKEEGYDFLKIYNTDYDDCTPFDTVVAAAKRAGLPFAGHAVQQVGLKHVLESGYRSIEHWTGYVEYFLAASNHGRITEDSAHHLIVSPEFGQLAFVNDDADIEAIAKATQRAGVWNVPTQAVFTAATKGKFDTLVRRLIKALIEVKAGILLGTDTYAVSEELRGLIHVGLTPYQALETTTRNVAAFYGALDTLGTVATGKRADLVLLDDNPLKDIHAAAQPAGTMVAGRWYPRDELIRQIQASQ